MAYSGTLCPGGGKKGMAPAAVSTTHHEMCAHLQHESCLCLQLCCFVGLFVLFCVFASVLFGLWSVQQWRQPWCFGV